MKYIFSFIFLAILVACTTDNEEVYFGCTNPVMMNFDPNATADDGSCLYHEGCMDSKACNYNELAFVDNGTCEYADNMYYLSNDGATSIESIIDNKCATCHNQENMANVQYIILETYEQLTDLNNIIEVINRPPDHSKPMPPDGYSQLTDCEKLQIENWINNGSLYDENNR